MSWKNRIKSPTNAEERLQRRRTWVRSQLFQKRALISFKCRWELVLKRKVYIVGENMNP